MGWRDWFRNSWGAPDEHASDIAAPPSQVSESDVIRAAEQLGLGRVLDDIQQSLLQSLRFDLLPLESTIVGQTRLGGEPDLPSGVDWPHWDGHPLIFIGQLALTDLAGTTVDGELPSEGLLSFWYAGAERAWGFDPRERDASRVLFLAPGGDLEQRAQPDGLPYDGSLKACTWRPRPQLTIPPWESSTVDAWNLTNEERERYFDLHDWMAYGEDSTIHRLLGHPDPIQGDMQLECQLVTNGLYCGDATGDDDPRREELAPRARDWRLLLQIDSDQTLGSEWGDVGRVYFWIRTQDLAAARFDAAWHVMQCS